MTKYNDLLQQFNDYKGSVVKADKQMWEYVERANKREITALREKAKSKRDRADAKLAEQHHREQVRTWAIGQARDERGVVDVRLAKKIVTYITGKSE